jgi:hypothetical protein
MTADLSRGARLAGIVAALLAACALTVFVAVVGYRGATNGVDRISAMSRLSSHGRVAQGTVIGKRDQENGPAGHSEWIRVRFTAEDGTRYELWTVGDQKVGDTVRVRYDPREPGHAIVGSMTLQKVNGVLLIVVSLLLAISAPSLFLKLGWEYRKKRKRAPAPG